MDCDIRDVIEGGGQLVCVLFPWRGTSTYSAGRLSSRLSATSCQISIVTALTRPFEMGLAQLCRVRRQPPHGIRRTAAGPCRSPPFETGFARPLSFDKAVGGGSGRFKYVWVIEYHFLDEYSHLSAK